MKQSFQKALKQTDVWKDDTLLFRLNGSGVSNASHHQSQFSKSPARSVQGSRLGGARNPPKLKGHNPTSTMRDKDLFS